MRRKFLEFGFGMVLAWATAAAALADRYALLIAINDYQPAGESRGDLWGTENDLELMRQTLVRHYGFPDDSQHLVVLIGLEATREAILAAWEQMAARVGDGDDFVFFYSGHGTFIEDKNGDEPDGYDEALVTSDVRPILDDEIGAWLKRVHGRKTLILDSCHSGTGTKDITNRTRGKSFNLPGQPPRTRFKGSGSGMDDADELGMNHVLIAGCRDDQQSGMNPHDLEDGKTFYVSDLTYFLCEGLRGAADANRDGIITVREAAAYAERKVSAKQPPAKNWAGAVAKQVIAPGQTVQLEGSGKDQSIFGVGRFRPLEARIETRNGEKRLNVGAVHGFQPGATFRVAGAGTVEITKLGIFDSAFRTASGGEPSGGATGTPEAAPPPGETARLTVRVAIAENNAELVAAARKIAEALQREPFLRVADRDEEMTDVVVRLHRNAAQVMFTLAWPGGRIETGKTAAGEDFSSLLAGIREALASAFAVRRMNEVENPHAKFSLQIETDRGGANPVYRVGEQMQLSVTATEPCYVTLIDIGTSGNLSVFYPPPGQEPPQLTPDRPLVLPKPGAFVQVEGPPGVDRIKVIATKKPLPLGSLVGVKSTGTNVPRSADGVLNALRQLGQSAKGAKGVGDVLLPYDEWAETSIGIEIR